MPSPSQIHQQCPCALVVALGHNDHRRRNAAGRDWARAERSFDGNSVASRRLPFVTLPYALPLSLSLALALPHRCTVASALGEYRDTVDSPTLRTINMGTSTTVPDRRQPNATARPIGTVEYSSALLLFIIRCRFRRLTICSRTVAATTSCSRSRTGCAARCNVTVCGAVPVRFSRSRIPCPLS
jgi:hypothetical protein